MRIYIFADIEGISGISGADFTREGTALYPQGCLYMTEEVNACAAGCLQAGAEAVLVRDGHSSGYNLRWDLLDPRLEVIQGPGPRQRLPGIEACDALILLGYHARAGTPGAVLEHTYSGEEIQQMWLNGRPAGEFAFDAGVASDYGVPAIMVSGDDKVCAEAREWVPEIVACQVKTGLGRYCARLLPRDEAHRRITAAADEAVRRRGEIPPMRVERPVTIRKEGVERSPVPTDLTRPNARLIDGRTFELTAPTVEAALMGMW